MNEQLKYEVIKSLVDHNGNKKAAALKLGCTTRHINRLIQKYKQNGKAAFIHGNRGRKPLHSFTESQKLEILTLYNNKYYDATFTYACELLAKNDGIFISPSALTKIMYENFIPSPRTTKTVRKRLAKELRTQQKNVSTKKKAAAASSQTRNAPMSVSASDRDLMAAIIYCEAGAEPYQGKVAVGAVIMNRVRSSRFPNTISGVIYQKGQFGPAITGKLGRVLASGKATAECYKAADAALAGENPIGNRLFFGNGNTGYKIGSHYFH